MIRGFRYNTNIDKKNMIIQRGPGYDLMIDKDIVLKVGMTTNIDTGIYVYKLADEYLQLQVKLSMAIKYRIIMENGCVFIEKDGFVTIQVLNLSDKDVMIKKGDIFLTSIFLKKVKK